MSSDDNRPFPQLSDSFTSHSSPNTSSEPSFEGSNAGRGLARCNIGPLYQQVTIETLPDDVLIDIFGFYWDEWEMEAWHTLVHVCQRWRYIVFASPRRLHLQLQKNLDNILAALERNDRVCSIALQAIPSTVLERVAAAMQEPFPELTDLTLWSNDGRVTVLTVPETFLGGSAPRLRSCRVDSLPFPALRKLALSASHLVDLEVSRVPLSGYGSPDVLINCLSTMTNLERLSIGFRSPPDRRPPHPTRTNFPALTHLTIRGFNEYSEDFISRIDTPRLSHIHLAYFYQNMLDVSQLYRFIDRTEKLMEVNAADVNFYDGFLLFYLYQEIESFFHRRIWLRINAESTPRLLSLAQVCTSSFPPLPTVETLYIYEPRYLEEEMENIRLVELFRLFPAVKNLYLYEDAMLRVAPVLQQLAREGVTDVLPMLQNLYLKEPQPSRPIQDAIDQFVVTRGVSVTLEPQEDD